MDPEEVAERTNASQASNTDAPATAAEADAWAAAEWTDERRGPPIDLPAQVPDRVKKVHQRIGIFLGSELDNCGAAVSDVTPAEDADADESEHADAAEDADEDYDVASEDAESAEDTDDEETETATAEA